jgi:hypothetical protein
VPVGITIRSDDLWVEAVNKIIQGDLTVEEVTERIGLSSGSIHAWSNEFDGKFDASMPGGVYYEAFSHT